MTSLGRGIVDKKRGECGTGLGLWHFTLDIVRCTVMLVGIQSNVAGGFSNCNYNYITLQLCLTLAVSKLMVDSHYGQYLRGTGEMC